MCKYSDNRALSLIEWGNCSVFSARKLHADTVSSRKT